MEGLQFSMHILFTNIQKPQVVLLESVLIICNKLYIFHDHKIYICMDSNILVEKS